MRRNVRRESHGPAHEGGRDVRVTGVPLSELAPYFQLLQDFDHRNIIALDRAHNIFLVGAVLSLKPDEVLELGVGTGYVTSSLTFLRPGLQQEGPPHERGQLARLGRQ